MSVLRKKITGLGGFLQRKDSSEQNDDVDESASVVPLLKRFFASAHSSDDTGALVQAVDLVFSNPRQAKEAAKLIRKELSDRNKDAELYNAAMVTTILARHEESSRFTQYMDDRFVGTVKLVLRDTSPRTAGTRLLIREFIQEVEATTNGQQSYRTAALREEGEHRAARWITDPGMQRLLDLRKDPKNWVWVQTQQRQLNHPPPQMQQAMMASRQQQQQITSLPGPHELAERLTEADSSASMLSQMILATPNTVLTDELIQEFHSRCVSARNSLEMYMRLTSDRATLTNIDTTKLKVVKSLDLYDSAVRRHLSRPDPQQVNTEAVAQNARAFAQQPTLQIASPAPVRALPQQSAANGTVSPIDASAWSDNPFDDKNESGQPATSSTSLARSQNETGDRPALSLAIGSVSRPVAPVATSNGVGEGTPDLATEPERPSRYRF